MSIESVHETPPTGRKRKIAAALVIAALVSVASAAVAPTTAEAAAGPYWKTVRDTGITCSTPGRMIYISTRGLTSSEQMQGGVADWHGSKEMWRDVRGRAAGSYKIYYRMHTYAGADTYWFCSGTWREQLRLSAPRTKCLLRYGWHASGFPQTTNWAWTGDTFTGHVTKSPC